MRSAVPAAARPAHVVGQPAITNHQLKSAMVKLEAEGLFARRAFKTMTFWRRQSL
jgi:hypothetical protein